jgi:hypothetical protein
MIGLLLALILGVTLYVAAWKVSSGLSRTVVILVVGGYVARLALSVFLRDVPLFSHGVGGDYGAYELEARMIARLWTYEHFHYVTGDELPMLGRTTLPPNLFAVVTYLNGGDSQLGSTSIVACLACMTCLNIFSLALESGASHTASTRVLATLLFLPSFLFYTSDVYKDGIVQFCVVGIAGSALRLSREFSFKHFAFAIACLAALSGTRFYLVYATAIPLVLGVLGFRSRSALRIVASITAVCLGALAFVGLTDASDIILEDANTAYESGTSREVYADAIQQGSGVDVEGSGFGEGLLYTLFAPFLWQSGSLGFQLGKIDSLIWYVTVFFAAKGALRLAKSRKSELVILLSFVVPTTLAYAAVFNNVGLTVRERLGVVMVCALIAAMGTSEKAAEQKPVEVVQNGLLKPRWSR